jgi:methionyl aminopeptidase
MITIKTSQEIELMRFSGSVTAKVLNTLAKEARPGVSTLALDKIAEEIIRSYDCVPAFLNYNGFPASICASINEEVIHGIPLKERVLAEGDILSVDTGAIYKGYYSDAARTFPIGSVSETAQRLIDVTRESLEQAMPLAVEGNRLGDVSAAIQEYVEQNGFQVVRDYVGHGIGTQMHEGPSIPNYGRRGRGIQLKENMTLAVEPMVNAGTYQVRALADGWTVVTADRSLSAHYENTLWVRKGTCESLTTESV